MNWQVIEVLSCSLPEGTWENHERPQSSWYVGIPDEIRTVDLPNANCEPYRLARLDQYVSHFDGLCGGKFTAEMKRRKMNCSIVDPAVYSRNEEEKDELFYRGPSSLQPK